MFLVSLIQKSALLLGLTVFQVQPQLAATTPKAAPKVVAVKRVDSVLSQVQRYFNATESLSGSFKQVSLKARTGRRSQRSGQVRLMRPNLIRWDFRSPEPVHYVANNDDLWVYQPQDALAYRMNVGDSDLDQAIRFLAGGIDLKATFNAKLTEMPKGLELNELTFIELLPKKPTSSYKKLVLGVEEKSGAVRFSMIIDPDGNQTRTTYENLNAKKLSKRVFEFSPPEGVHVQDLSKRGSGGR